MEPAALASGLDDLAAVGEAVECGSGEPLGPQDLGPGLEGQLGGHDHAGPLVGGGDHVEEQLGSDLRDWHVAEFVEGE
jgi:hypothetical protein